MKNHVRGFLVLPALTALLFGCDPTVEALLVTGGHSYDTTQFFKLFDSLEGVRVDTVSHPRAMEMLGSEAIHRFDVLVFYDYIPEQPGDISDFRT